MNRSRPERDRFMDPDMKRLWERMDPRDLTDGGFMLYGGTALALYLDHRSSTDFDFFTLSRVTRDQVAGFRWLGRGREIYGEEGAVDVSVAGDERNVRMTFLQVDLYFGLEPEFDPVLAPNGIPVAVPSDLLVGKIAALTARGTARDYRDVAAAARHLPDELDHALVRYCGHEQRLEDRRELAKTILRYSFEVEYALTPEELRAVEGVADRLDPEGRASRARAQRRRSGPGPDLGR